MDRISGGLRWLSPRRVEFCRLELARVDFRLRLLFFALCPYKLRLFRLELAIDLLVLEALGGLLRSTCKVVNSRLSLESNTGLVMDGKSSFSESSIIEINEVSRPVSASRICSLCLRSSFSSCF